MYFFTCINQESQGNGLAVRVKKGAGGKSIGRGIGMKRRTVAGSAIL